MSTDAQNIYDNPDFFAGYARIRENPLSANAVIVDPMRDELLPPLAGKRVVDMGCGAGGFCRKAIAAGAASVVGVDISERMLATAEEEPVNSGTEPRLSYVRSSLDTFHAESESADVVVSILALHYLPEVATVFAHVARILAPGGVFVFCIEHPVVTARYDGWHRDADGNKLHWMLDNYSHEGERVSEWLVEGVRTYHRTLSTYLNTLFESGLTVTRIGEPLPTKSAVAAQPSYIDDWRRPLFLFVRAQKR